MLEADLHSDELLILKDLAERFMAPVSQEFRVDGKPFRRQWEGKWPALKALIKNQTYPVSNKEIVVSEGGKRAKGIEPS